MDSDLIMVAFGYHGSAFHGSQVQPVVETVQGNLIKALKSLKWWSEGCLKISSRTDAGVSARMNLATIKLPNEIAGKIDPILVKNAINHNTPEEIVVWGGFRVPPDTRSRFAISRTYFYHCGVIPSWPKEVDIIEFKEMCSVVIGRHDFTNLCRNDPDRSPIRTIDSCEPWVDPNGRIIGFSVKAESFLWNQIRRIAAAFDSILSGKILLKDLQKALDEPQFRVDFGRAPSDGLILWTIEHESIKSFSNLPEFIEIIPKDINESKRADERLNSLSKLEISTLLEREWLNL